MQEEDGPMFETFSELEGHVSGIETVQELFIVAFGLAHQQNLAGFVCSGHAFGSVLSQGNWGSGRRFGSSIIYLRSYPPGRFGLPLRPGEVRLTATCCANVKKGGKVVSIAKIYCVDGLLKKSLQVEDSIRQSCGPFALQAVPLLIWNDHVWSGTGVSLRSTYGHRVVAPTSLTIVDKSGSRPTSSGYSDFQVAAGMVSLAVSDTLHRPVEVMSDVEHIRLTARNTTEVVGACGDEVLAGDTIAGATLVCEDVSAAGIVDLVGCPLLYGALPDALGRPDALMSVIAVMARIAANPDRVGLGDGTMNDRWAAGEVAAAFEASFVPVVRSGDADLMAIDVAVNAALNTFTTRHGQSSISFATVEHLFRCGVALCIDVCGPTQEENPYTAFGMSNVADDVCIAHLASAHSVGLGRLFPGVAATRLTGRGERQETLLRILDSVEMFLRCPDDSDTHWRDANGFAVPPTNEEAEDGTPTTLNLHALRAVQATIERVLHRGPFVLESEQVDFFAVSRAASLECARCTSSLHVLEAGLFHPTNPYDENSRPLCFACGQES